MALRYKRTFKVKLETPDGSCELEFRKRPLNKQIESEAQIAKLEVGEQQARMAFTRILDYLVGVTGLIDDETGQDMKVQDFKNLEFDLEFILHVLAAHAKELKKQNPEVEQGNAKNGTGSPSDSGSTSKSPA